MATCGGARWGRKGGGPIPGKGVLFIELKNRILVSLHKLSDRDTEQLAMEELELIAHNLTPEGIALFLACLFDTDGQQKSVVRRDCLRLVGKLASLHKDLMACHLPKMVGNIVRRLKDPDSNIRDACVETIGIMASQVSGFDGLSTINVFVKPLLEALAEQHKVLQTGASLCLARVIESARDPDPHILHRLCPRIVKMLGSPNFLAKASLLNVVGVMVQVPGVVSMSQLPSLLGSVQEELDNSEWTVKKAAAETLSNMATAVGGVLGSYRGSVLATLENNRFDKVKPVRDSVTEALQLWKTVYDPNAPPIATSGSSGSASPSRCFEVDATASISDRRNNMRGLPTSISDTCGRNRSMSNGRAVPPRKRTPISSDKKPNPDFFRKLQDARDSIEWQTFVDCPRHSPQEESLTAEAASSGHLVYHGNCVETAQRCDTPSRACGASDSFTLEEGNGVDLNYDQEGDGELKKPAANGAISSNSYQDPHSAVHRDTSDNPESWGHPQVIKHQSCEYESPWVDGSLRNDGDRTIMDMRTIHRHLHSLERQQLSMMEMLQDFMVCAHDSMHDLEGRVAGLEQILEDVSQNFGTTDGSSPASESPRCQGGHPLSQYLSGGGFINFKNEKDDEDTSVLGSARSQDSLVEKTEHSDELTSSSSHQIPSAAETLRRPNFLDCSPLHGGNGNDGGMGKGPRRAGVLPREEDPSTGAVWHASKAKITAGVCGSALQRKSVQKHASRDFNVDKKPNRAAGAPFWILWSRAMDSVRGGDLDLAYSEILGSSDELLLVRLMGCTGPVLDQLNAATVFQLVGCIKRFLDQQSFLNCIIPWLQQVSDIVSSNGPNSLGLTRNAKKDLVFSLQEATSSEYAQRWMRAKIAQLAQHLRNAWSSSWSIDIVDN
uniref:TOG domain-containing protein n=1 Tax=Physcomitrium patens TaxID=3218 RepID=A0A2K1IFT2_PHYPA|nr:hypothetical protein PHYPA_028716 [Physcomitrium patens]